MAKAPFTSAGAQQKIAELYALPDSQLLVQADLARTQFRQWVSDNFVLDAAQTVYLNAISPAWLEASGADTSYALRNRLDIKLIFIGPVEASKILRRKPKFIDTFKPATGNEPGGWLEFEVVYGV